MTAVVLAAAELKIAAMPQYNAFVLAFKVYAERQIADLMVAEKDQIFQAQGKAQQAATLTGKLEDCIKLREDIKRRS